MQSKTCPINPKVVTHLDIPVTANIAIKQIGITSGMDGHSMRTQKYFADQMPDITHALIKAETATKFWIDDKGEYQCQ